MFEAPMRLRKKAADWILTIVSNVNMPGKLGG